MCECITPYMLQNGRVTSEMEGLTKEVSSTLQYETAAVRDLIEEIKSNLSDIRDNMEKEITRRQQHTQVSPPHYQLYTVS